MRGGSRVPPDTSADWEISADLPGKERQGKKGTWRRKEGKLKKGWKLTMDGRKVSKWGEDFFFFFFALLFTFYNFKTQNHWNLFWNYQNGHSTRKKHFMLGKKSGKNDFAPSEKFSSYAPDRYWWTLNSDTRWNCRSWKACWDGCPLSSC